MYRIWYSTESFADYIIDHTFLRKITNVKKCKISESDANNPLDFYTIPDHIRKILYLDAPDLIIELNDEPILSIEITTEAGTGHNVFQRFARIAAAAENNVPVIYIYPEGKLVHRKSKEPLEAFDRWDSINPLIFLALDDVKTIFDIPALLFYFPSDMTSNIFNSESQYILRNGLHYDSDESTFPGCPDSTDSQMLDMFNTINEICYTIEKRGISMAKPDLLKGMYVRDRTVAMLFEYGFKAKDQIKFSQKDYLKPSYSMRNKMSPLSSVTIIETEYLLNYLSQYEINHYHIGELLKSRKQTAIYQANASFRGDPYPGCLAAIDYLICRTGKTLEDRNKNLVMVWGKVEVDDANKTITISNEKGSTINDFFRDVKKSSKHNLLVKNYSELKPEEIPRYFMQIRYGSTYSKLKHIRVYSYFADAILFPDGSLWRDA
ncbi:MAG: hypothetical protein LUE27_02220 [Clostridia bacterium]|nr:hypothetical protein [Clostridia bacterium]